MVYFLSQWLWAIFLVLLLVREVYIGYKYGTQEPLKTKKGLQRQLYYLLVICFVSWIVFELVVPKESIFVEYDEELIEEVKTFNQQLSSSTLEEYKKKFLTHEWEIPININEKISLLEQHEEYLYHQGGMYIQENPALSNTVKISILQTPYIDTKQNLIYEMDWEVTVTVEEENEVEILVPPVKKQGTLNVVDNIAFKDSPWLFTLDSSYSPNQELMYFYIIVEVPIGSEFIELNRNINYLDDRYIY